MKNKKWIIVFSIVVIGIAFTDALYYNWIDNPFFNNLGHGLNILEGYPTYINGRMWRINQTNYVIWTNGHIINLKTDHEIGNFSICYAVTIQFSVNSLWLKFNQTELPYFHNETSCEHD